MKFFMSLLLLEKNKQRLKEQDTASFGAGNLLLYKFEVISPQYVKQTLKGQRRKDELHNE